MILQEEIIKELGVKIVIDPSEEVRKSIDFLKKYLVAHPSLKSLVLGISGGQDSALTARLAQLAIEEMREETGISEYQFIAVRLPYGKQVDEADARRALTFIQADKELTIDIKPAVDAQVLELEKNGCFILDFNKGNIKARQRMITQYAIASTFSGAVLGTDHAAENITGFFTKFGDGAADLLPIFRLNKRQGKQLLEYLGASKEIYTKIPTADLEDDRPQIADEIALGVTYDEIDDYLEGKTIQPTSQKIIEDWWEKNQHKRQLPVTIFDVLT